MPQSNRIDSDGGEFELEAAFGVDLQNPFAVALEKVREEIRWGDDLFVEPGDHAWTARQQRGPVRWIDTLRRHAQANASTSMPSREASDPVRTKITMRRPDSGLRQIRFAPSRQAVAPQPRHIAALPVLSD